MTSKVFKIVSPKAKLICSVIFTMLLSPTIMAQTSRPTSQPDAKPTTKPLEKSSQLMASFADNIEQAHGMKVWQKMKAVEADMVLKFGGNEALNCKLIYDMHTSKVRMELKDGTILVFDGEHAWVSPSESKMRMARFHLLTWSYFLAAPFKLRDPGTHLESSGPLPINNILSSTAKLTFDKGVGDAPDDWYIVYPQLETHQLAALAYIISYGKDVKEAEKQPHAIVFHEYKDIEGVKLSTFWTMHHWSKTEGPHGDPMGTVRLSNIKFIRPDKDRFTKPDDAREDKLPDSST